MSLEKHLSHEPDAVLTEIARYVTAPPAFSDEAYETARWVMLDAIGCGLLALRYPECTKLLGPTVPGTRVEHGVRVPGTAYQLDPVQAAFNIGTMNRWLDYNDTWLAAEWGHPSDNLAAVLAVADWIGRRSQARGDTPPTLGEALSALIRAHEIQGVLALTLSLNRVGLDHVLLVKVASAAVATAMLGGGRDDVIRVLSHAWIDNGSLRTYRHAPNTGSRKSWAAGDAGARAVWLALMGMRGEMGYPLALSSPGWGFQDVMLHGEPIRLAQPLGSYVMENVLFKISYPAEFHGQTAVEAAIALHPRVVDRLDAIERIEIETQESAVRIIDKTGPLHNPADRDHCLQYMTAVGLLFGRLDADDYEDRVAADPGIDRLREKMRVRENPDFSRDYLDPDKRSIANAVQVFFKDGTNTPKVTVEYPIGHRRRRAEGQGPLEAKLRHNLSTQLPAARVEALMELARDRERFEALSVSRLLDALTPGAPLQTL